MTKTEKTGLRKLFSRKKTSRLQPNNNQSPVKTPTSSSLELDKTVLISNINPKKQISGTQQQPKQYPSDPEQKRENVQKVNEQSFVLASLAKEILKKIEEDLPSSRTIITEEQKPKKQSKIEVQLARIKEKQANGKPLNETDERFLEQLQYRKYANRIKESASILPQQQPKQKEPEVRNIFGGLYSQKPPPTPQVTPNTKSNPQQLSPEDQKKVDKKKIEIINDKISDIRQEIEQDYPYPGYLTESDSQAYASLQQDIDNLEQLRSGLERKLKIAPDDEILNKLNKQITDEAQKALNPSSSPQVPQYKELSINPDGTYNY